MKLTYIIAFPSIIFFIFLKYKLNEIHHYTTTGIAIKLCIQLLGVGGKFRYFESIYLQVNGGWYGGFSLSLFRCFQ
jgi:hypothetical protein